MKKLMKVSVLWAATLLLAGSLHAQMQKTYMSENFESQSLSSGWSLSECTPITSSATGTLYLEQISDGSTVWGGWAYDPNGQIIDGSINNQLNGTYAMVTNSFKMEENAINVVLLDYWYIGTNSDNAQNRLFGISVRAKDGEWQDLDSIQNMTDGLKGQLNIVLDEELNGQDVQLRFFFRNKHNANAYFMFLMDNITFAAYKDGYKYSAHIANPYYLTMEATGAANTKVDFDLDISNTGKAISSIEYAYTTNNGTQKNATVSLSSPIPAVTGQGSATISIQFDNGLIGDNSIKMWPVKVNGEAFEAGAADTVRHQLMLVDQSKLPGDDFVPLMECFTASWCPPCATLNRYMKPALDELRDEGKISVIKYQASGDKYYISATGVRQRIYSDIDGYGYIPFPIYNGKENIMRWPGSTYTDLMNVLKQRATEDHQEKAMMAIDITKADADANTEKLELSFSVTSAFSGNASVFAVVTEKTTKGNRGTNGEREFHWVTMDIPTSGNGRMVKFEAGVPQTFTYTVDMGNTNMEEITDLEVVCFVQDRTSKKIFQSATSDVTAMNVANENKDNLQVALYPNPAKGYTVLKGLENARVSVFDMTGRMVFNTKTSEESLNIDLSRFAAGTYMVRVEQNGATAHRKLVVTK